MTLLITGSAGFIGSNLCHYFQSKGREFIHLDGLLQGSEFKNLGGIKSSLILCNLLSESTIEGIFRDYKITEIVHLAAESHVDRSVSGDLSFWQSNVIGTSNLMRAAYKAGINKFINQISDEFYGEIPIGTSPAVEGQVPNSTSPYACSKTAQYYVGRAFHKTHGLPVVSTFPVNCFGPGQALEKLIPKFITNLLADRKVPLMKSSHFQRDWLPVIDMCRALELLLDEGVPGEDYNIGANNHLSNMELTKKLLHLMDKPESLIEIVPDRKAHDCRYAVDWSKIRQLGFASSCTFDSYLEETVHWYTERYGNSIH